MATTHLARDPARAQRHLADIYDRQIRDQQQRELAGIRRTLDKLRDEQDRRERLSPWRDMTRDGQLTVLIRDTEQRLREAEAWIDTERACGFDPEPLPRDADPSYRRGQPPAWYLEPSRPSATSTQQPRPSRQPTTSPRARARVARPAARSAGLVVTSVDRLDGFWRQSAEQAIADHFARIRATAQRHRVASR
jgi:hypothetical protein